MHWNMFTRAQLTYIHTTIAYILYTYEAKLFLPAPFIWFEMQRVTKQNSKDFFFFSSFAEIGQKLIVFKYEMKAKQIRTEPQTFIASIYIYICNRIIPSWWLDFLDV